MKGAAPMALETHHCDPSLLVKVSEIGMAEGVRCLKHYANLGDTSPGDTTLLLPTHCLRKHIHKSSARLRPSISAQLHVFMSGCMIGTTPI